MGDDKTPVDSAEVTGWERTLKQAFELWVGPEVQRRVAAGLLKEPIAVTAAQVLFSDDRPPVVRLNKEIKGIFHVRVKRAVEAGAVAHSDDIANFEGMDLVEEDRDFGHFTLVQHHDQWVMLFDFGRNKAHALGLVDLAAQFIEAAEFSFQNGLRGPLIDTLFSAYELLARARLITTVLKREGSRTHGHINSTINSWRKLGNVGSDFVDLYNRLSSARGAARYHGNGTGLTVDAETFRIAKEQIAELRARFGPRAMPNGGKSAA